MPTDLIHRIGIAAATETIYHAITIEEGIRAWWTSISARVGAERLGRHFACSFLMRKHG
jgi:uncharacterized protein YndB with AHSA1/START domain